MNKIISLTLLGIGVQSFLSAVAVSSPEIDPSSAVSAIALLAGAVAVIRGRRK